jgi:hypothetical protein
MVFFIPPIILSIVATVISLVGSLVGLIITATIPTLFSLRSNRGKQLSESEKLVAKYREPLLRATTDLQSHLHNIYQRRFLSDYHQNRSKKDYVDFWTPYVVGRFFSWVHILRRQVQFLQFPTDKNNKKLLDALDAIEKLFSTDDHSLSDPDEALFTLWRGQQVAIGEIMTVTEGEELVCMRYSIFARNYNVDTFQQWFEPISEGITRLVDEHSHTNHLPGNKLRRVEHRLLELMDILDPNLSYSGPVTARGLVDAAPDCGCVRCR